MDVPRWSMDADLNQAPPPDGAPEGWKWPRVNDTLREHMAAVARWYNAPEWLELVPETSLVSRSDETTVRIEDGDYTALFAPGARVRLGADAVMVDADVVSSATATGGTDVVVSGNEVPLGCNSIRPHMYATVRSAAFREVYNHWAITESIVPAEWVRDFSAGEAAFFGQQAADITVAIGQIRGLTLGRTANPRVVPGADGETEFWIFLDIAFEMNFLDSCELTVDIFIGNAASPSFPSERIFTATYGQTAEGFSENVDRRISIPALSIGRPLVSDRLGIWFTNSSGSSASVTVRGLTGAPLSPSHLMIRRQGG